MYQYEIHAFCDACSEPHFTGVVIGLDELVDAEQSVADVYDGRDVPAEIVNMTNNAFTCPNTRQMYVQTDNSRLFLVLLPSR